MLRTANTIEISDWTQLPTAPVVSVYMLAYLHEKFIAQAIEGVIAQRCDFQFELIIGEDCSPDSTRDIALGYQRRHPELIRVVTADRNVGARANANRCQKACRGTYVAICEGDDYWHDINKLADQIRLMESNPGMVLCHTDFDRLTRFRRRRNVHRFNHQIKPASGHAYHDLLQTWSVMTATSVYRREVLQDFGRSPFYSDRWPFGDLNLLLYASLQGTIGYIGRSTATFRRTRGSAGNSGNAAHLRMSLATEECVEQFMAAYPPPPSVSRSARAILKMRILRFAFFVPDYTLFESCKTWLLENGYPVPLAGRSPIAQLVAYPKIIRIVRIIKEQLDLALSDR